MRAKAEERPELGRSEDRDKESGWIPDDVSPEERATPQRRIEEGREVQPAEVLGVAQAPLIVDRRIGRDRFPPDGPDDP